MNFKYQDPWFYSRLFDESEDGPFELPPGRTNTYDKNVLSPNAPKSYVLQGNKSACLFWSLSSAFSSLAIKLQLIVLKISIPSLKANGRLRFFKKWH